VGADAVVQSSHKILSALSQAAVLHTRDARVDEASVRKVLQLLQTTSPSFAIMASIDTARRQMVLEGKSLLDATLRRARRAREELARISGLAVLGAKHTRGKGSGFYDLDETKIVLRTDALGLTGYEVQRILNAEHGVQPELGGTAHVLFIMTIGNTDEDVDRLVSAMRSIASSASRARGENGGVNRVRETLRPVGLSALPPVVLTPREAFYARGESVAFARAEGRVSAEVVTPYPPGIPVLMPGERITRQIMDGLLAVRKAGCPISASDASLETMQVVA
jgi:arginine/lysine/ornithine decarboxylase